MKTQIDLIGDHPSLPNIFAKWLSSTDNPVTGTKRHRSLSGIIASDDPDLIEWLGRKLFDHHHSDFRVEQLKINYTKLNYPGYAEMHRKLPIADRTRKGNATEIILTEYIESCIGRSAVKAFKLKYNPNADQALKGDDTLLVDIVDNGSGEVVKVYLGEAKYRTAPTKKVVGDISSSLAKDKKPLSFSFLVEELARNPATLEIAKKLDAVMIDDIKGRGNLIYTGLLLSDLRTEAKVEATLNSDNPDFVMISIGIENPIELIKHAFTKAESFVTNPATI